MKKITVFSAALLFCGLVWSSCSGDKTPPKPEVQQPETTSSAAPAAPDSAAIKMEEATQKIEENSESLQKALNDL